MAFNYASQNSPKFSDLAPKSYQKESQVLSWYSVLESPVNLTQTESLNCIPGLWCVQTHDWWGFHGWCLIDFLKSLRPISKILSKSGLGTYMAFCARIIGESDTNWEFELHTRPLMCPDRWLMGLSWVVFHRFSKRCPTYLQNLAKKRVRCLNGILC
jgi:hypothetical protein